VATLVIDLMDRRPIWALPDRARERIVRAVPAEWTVKFMETPADGSGDGVQRAPPELVEAVRSAKVYMGYGIPAEVLRAGPAIEWVHSGAAGVGSSLGPEMLASDVLFTNSAGIHAEPMSETVIAMIFHFARGLDLAVRAQREDKIGVMLGVEGGHMIDSSIEVLRQLYRLGTRYLGLTHSGNTPWVGAAEYDDGPEGLTDHGREIVRAMNRMGMMADLSHASQKAFFDTVETSSAPILNTHAACFAIAQHPRNLTDEMLKALADNGGVLGVAYYTGMLDDGHRARFKELAEISSKRREVGQQFGGDLKQLSQELWKLNLAEVELIGAPPISRLVDHIEHAATVAGIDHVGLGSDYDSVGLKLPAGLEHIGKTPNLIEAMKERGFSDEDVAKVMGGNALRALRAAEAAAA